MKKPFTDHSHELHWVMKAKRSNGTPSPPWHPTAEEYAVAESLLLLATSGGGFYNSTPIAAVPITILPPTKAQQLWSSSASTSAAVSVKRPVAEGSPDTPLPEMMNIHRCWMCGKAFESFQALGGHMSCYRIRTENAAARSPEVHECPLCHEKFPTGQALGGHKRKHYQGELHPRKANRVAGEIPNGRVTIDLNLPPPLEG